MCVNRHNALQGRCHAKLAVEDLLLKTAPSLGVKKRRHKGARVERLQIINALANAHKLDG